MSLTERDRMIQVEFVARGFRDLTGYPPSLSDRLLIKYHLVETTPNVPFPLECHVIAKEVLLKYDYGVTREDLDKRFPNP